jgi:UDP-N-acetylmuramoyl-tripeptide--D-alanyl-D-alanine ligase
VKLSLDFCARAANGRLVPSECGSVEAASYSTDSRTIESGALFFALSGPSHDGHDHVAAAIARGAVAAVVARYIEDAGPQLIVNDTLTALQAIALAARLHWGDDEKRGVIAITGSAGKTITKEAVAAVLSTAFRVGKTSGNYNNHIGVPLSILNLPDDCAAAVIEIGMNHAGEIRDLAKIALPRIGIVTNAGSAHIEAFDSMEGIALAKRELIEALPADGIAILNADDERVREFSEVHPGRSILYGISEAAEIRATEIAWSESGSCDFAIAGVGRFHCQLPARGGLMAVLAALATAHVFGLDLTALRETIANLTPPKMRLQRIVRDGLTIWNDCYNSNPEAACMMLELLAHTASGRRIAVLGEMLELGKMSEELHARVGLHAVQLEVSVLVGIRGAARHLVDAARGAGLSAGAAYFFDDPVTAGQFLKTIVRPGDTLLFKGSRGTRVELALEELLR